MRELESGWLMLVKVSSFLSAMRLPLADAMCNGGSSGDMEVKVEPLAPLWVRSSSLGDERF